MTSTALIDTSDAVLIEGSPVVVIPPEDFSGGTAPVAPVLLTASVDESGGVLTLVFDRAIEVTPGQELNGFVLTVDGVARPLTFASLSLGMMTATLLPVALLGNTLLLSYTEAGGTVFEATGTEPLASFTDTPVTNNSTQTAPQLLYANIDSAGTTLTMQFNEDIFATSGQEVNGFSFVADGVLVPLTFVSIVGSVLTATSTEIVLVGMVCTLSYSSETGTIVDSSATELASFTNIPVSNGSTMVAPIVTAASILASGLALELTFSMNVTATLGQETAGFVFKHDGIVEPLTFNSLVGNVLTFDLSLSVFVGDTATLDYDSSPGTIAGTNGVSLESFTNLGVTNQSTNTHPTLASATVSADGVTLTLVFSEDIVVASGQEIAGFTLHVGTSVVGLVFSSLSGLNGIIATITTTVPQGASTVLDYDSGPGTVVDTTGGALQSFFGAPVTNNSTQVGPAFVAAQVPVGGLELWVDFNVAISATPGQEIAGFTFAVNGAQRALTFSSFTPATRLVASFTPPVVVGDTLTVAYDSTPGTIYGTANGLQAPSIPTTSATNNSTVTVPVLNTATVDASGTLLTMVFDQSITYTPGQEVAGFTLDVNGLPVPITFNAGSSGATLLADISSVVAAVDTVDLSYDSGPGTIANVPGAILASFTGVAVTNGSTQAAPLLSTASVDTTGLLLDMVFSGNITATPGQEIAGLTLTVDGAGRGLTFNSFPSANTLRANLVSAAFAGQVCLLSYDSDPGTLQGTSNGLPVFSFNNAAVTNSSTVPAVTLTSATINAAGTTLTLQYSGNIAVTSGQEAAGFVLDVDGVTHALAFVNLPSASSMALSINPGVVTGQVVSLDYDSGPGTVVSSPGGLDAPSFNDFAVTNNSTTVAPVITGAAVAADGLTLDITFSQSITATAPQTNGLSFWVDNTLRSLTFSSYPSSSVMRCSVASVVYSGEACELAYDSSQGTIRNSSTNVPVASFIRSAITNNSTQLAYSAEAQAVFTRLQSTGGTLTTAQKDTLATFIDALVATGDWDRIVDVLCFALGPVMGLIGWKSATATLQNSATCPDVSGLLLPSTNSHARSGYTFGQLEAYRSANILIGEYVAAYPVIPTDGWLCGGNNGAYLGMNANSTNSMARLFATGATDAVISTPATPNTFYAGWVDATTEYHSRNGGTPATIAKVSNALSGSQGYPIGCGNFGGSYLAGLGNNARVPFWFFGQGADLFNMANFWDLLRVTLTDLGVPNVPQYSYAVQEVLDRMPDQAALTTEVKEAIATFVNSQVAAGNWDKFSSFYCGKMAGGIWTSQANALQNWKSSNSASLTAGATWNATDGYVFAASSQYIATQIRAANAPATQNSVFFGIGLTAGFADTNVDAIGVTEPGLNFRFSLNSTQVYQLGVNVGSVATENIAYPSGATIIGYRIASNQQVLNINGVDAITNNVNSTTPPSATIHVNGRNANGSHSNGGVYNCRAFFHGAAVGFDFAAFHSALQTLTVG